VNREQIGYTKRWVVKVGSALLTNDGAGLNDEFIAKLSQQISSILDGGIEVVLVSSGSVAAGMSQLGLKERPTQVATLQAAAAVGQASLVREYEKSFKALNIVTAQILLTHADIANRERYLNAKNTITQLLELNVLPVINENDTVATEEICFGDNDTLAAMVANLIDADMLVILTDQQGLFSADPRTNKDAQFISNAQADDESLLKLASGKGALGRGGMQTKLIAAQNASQSGASTVIASGRQDYVLDDIYKGKEVGTLLSARENPINAKKQWLAGQRNVSGTVVVDDGAASVLQQAGSSLLPVGVIDVKGVFKRGELIVCEDKQGNEIARGLTNYSSEEARQIMGLASSEIESVLNYGGDEELIHRDNMVLA